LEALLTEGNFYQLLIYDPIQLYKNLMAAYEVCNAPVFLDLAAELLGLDPNVIVETLTRQIVASITTVPPMINQFLAFVQGDDNTNYYQAGIIGGQLVKLFFDVNINN